MIDDESDYFSVDSNRWLTKDQREALKKRETEIREERHGSRLNRKITFDFAGEIIFSHIHIKICFQFDSFQDGG